MKTYAKINIKTKCGDEIVLSDAKMVEVTDFHAIEARGVRYVVFTDHIAWVRLEDYKQ